MKMIESIDYLFDGTEPIVGKEYLIYSYRTEKFYKRVVHEGLSRERIEIHLKRKILCK
jgi:hypothetical protein